MKRKMIATPKRNPYVKLALFRKAGSHRKSNKAIRRNNKTRDCSVNGSAQQTFNLPSLGSNPSSPTSLY